MTSLTEQEAAKRRCPFAREFQFPIPRTCIGGECMAWEWLDAEAQVQLPPPMRVQWEVDGLLLEDDPPEPCRPESVPESWSFVFREATGWCWEEDEESREARAEDTRQRLNSQRMGRCTRLRSGS